MRMVEVPGIGEDEIELDLGLSIGGSFGRLPAKSISRDGDGCTDSSGGRDAGLSRTSTSDSPIAMASDGDNESALMEVNERREIHAIHRREAKRKREEKQWKRGGSFGGRNEEIEIQPRPLKMEKREDGVPECNVVKNEDLDRTDATKQKQDPAAQMLHPYAPLHYVPLMNGYVLPCVMPYWPTGAAVNHGNKNGVHQPVACSTFRPFQMNQNIADVSLSNGCQLEQNGSKDGRSRKTGSGGSPISSSSVVSGNYQSSSSHEGCNSSYTISNSSISSSDQNQMTDPNARGDTNNRHSSLDHVKSKPHSDNKTHNSEKSVSRTNTTGTKDELTGCKQEVPSKKIKMENGKPPKPQIQSRNTASVQQMPCVSTTGIGPNGKTITGFLYRYSKSEVSILCVCHGKSFSPAEFVKHAGGTEVSHPLRHITVLPTADGISSASR